MFVSLGNFTNNVVILFLLGSFCSKNLKLLPCLNLPLFLLLQVQVPCCQPTSHKMVPILYVDEFSTLVISSVQLTRSCGCGPGNIQQLGEE